MQGIRRVITGISKERTFLVSLEDSSSFSYFVVRNGHPPPKKSQNEDPLEVIIPMKTKDSNLLLIFYSLSKEFCVMEKF